MYVDIVNFGKSKLILFLNVYASSSEGLQSVYQLLK